MRETRKTKQKLRKLQRARPLKGGALVLFATDEELLRLREEAEEVNKQSDNRKRASRRRQRRRCRRRGKGSGTVDTADKGRKESEQVESVHRAESRLKGPPPTRLLW